MSISGWDYTFNLIVFFYAQSKIAYIPFAQSRKRNQKGFVLRGSPV